MNRYMYIQIGKRARKENNTYGKQCKYDHCFKKISTFIYVLLTVLN